MISVFTDGSFNWATPPGYGFVAVSEQGEEITKGCGTVRNDGTASFAAEVAAVLAALTYAVDHGHNEVRILTDLETMAKHIARAQRADRRTMLRKLRAFLQAHPSLSVTVVKARAGHCMLQVAHHLARSAAAGAGRNRTALAAI